MAKRWHIEGYEGDNLVLDKWLDGRTSERKIAQVLARLVSTNLTHNEVIHLSLAAKDREALSALVRSTPEGLFTLVGGADYTAHLQDFDARPTQG